jgi:hypothetical protein
MAADLQKARVFRKNRPWNRALTVKIYAILGSKYLGFLQSSCVPFRFP